MLARAFPYALPAFVAVWLAHVALGELGDPLGSSFDAGLWLASSVLRVVALVGLFGVLARVHRHVSGSRRRAACVFLLWSATGIALLLVLGATRPWWAPLVGTDAVTYLSPTVPAPGGGERLWQSWIEPWQSGWVTTAEALVVIALSAVQALAAYRFGHESLLSAAGACFAVFLVLVGYLWWCPWFFLDYDNFHGDLVAGALAFDQLGPLASDPYTTVASPCYLSAWAACLAYLRLGAWLKAGAGAA